VDEESKNKEPLYLSSGSRDKKIIIWECWSGRQLLKINGHDNWVRSLCFHPSGGFLYSASDDKTIRVWELPTGR
jgi:platelet-activating factor acetylhydrolase IB subunit alpha